jgi:hypothetical protein
VRRQRAASANPKAPHVVCFFVPQANRAYGSHGYAALTVPLCVHPLHRQVAASRGCAAEAQPQPQPAPPS